MPGGALVEAFADPAAWRRIVFLIAAFPLGITYFVVLVTGLSTGIGLAITLLGIPVLLLTAVLWRMFARWERRLANALLGTDLKDPYRPTAPESAWWRRQLGCAADPATWKDLVYLMVAFPLGIVDFVVTVTLLGVALGLIATPFYYWAVPEGVEYGLVRVDTLPEALVALLVGVLAAPLAVQALKAFAGIHAAFARLMLGASPDPVLSARVERLTSSQARIIAAADAERRRLERDLHDGAQQRLVSVALTIRLAKDRLAKGEDALDLVGQAGEDAQLALAELRDLARGIHPAILTDRGLAPALEDLARRAPLPVDVLRAPEERFPPAVESTAYFVASEALANVAKHAEADSATVTVTADHESLVLVIADDGVGGAADGKGSGLRGLQDRVDALGGDLEIDSPPGRGTRVLVALPIVEERDEPALTESAEHRVAEVVDDRVAAILRLRSRRALKYHVAAYAIGNGAMIVIWLATGGGYFWPGWPLLAWGVPLALRIVHTLTYPPITESEVARERARDPGAPR